eukprot:12990152-Ditylum_brightwellii.AAC.1
MKEKELVDDAELSDNSDEQKDDIDSSLSTSSYSFSSEEEDNIAIINKDKMMGAIVWKLWEKRCKRICSDYAVMGWMLSLLPWVMEDCKENNKGLHQLAVEQ